MPQPCNACLLAMPKCDNTSLANARLQWPHLNKVAMVQVRPDHLADHQVHRSHRLAVLLLGRCAGEWPGTRGEAALGNCGQKLRFSSLLVRTDSSSSGSRWRGRTTNTQHVCSPAEIPVDGARLLEIQSGPSTRRPERA